ncbi:MAG: type II toxin-antitoxin system YoeB family toxin [Bacteroides sp.]
MSYIVNFTPEAKKALAKIKKSNQNLWKKTDKILHELVEDPRIGTGHPEPLKGGNMITYSRRLSAHDRISMISMIIP